MYDIIIIGAGTAGLSAAIYALRAGKSVLVLEEKSYGGQIITTPAIENYPGIKQISGFEFAQGLYEQALELGMKLEYGKVTGVSAVASEENTNKESQSRKEETMSEETELEAAGESRKGFRVEAGQKEYFSQVVILATGAKNRPLEVDREQELIGAGISYCATCDGAFFRGRDVAVVGGGNTALEDALFLSNYCRTVSIIHRRDTFRGEEKRLAALKEKDNVEFVLNSLVTALLGEDRLEGVLLWNRQEKEEKSLAVSGLFIAIGQMPDNEAFKELVEIDEKGYLVAGEDCRTSTEGIFAAGDCRTKSVRQLTTAASDGAVAALAACEYIDR